LYMSDIAVENFVRRTLQSQYAEAIMRVWIAGTQIECMRNTGKVQM